MKIISYIYPYINHNYPKKLPSEIIIEKSKFYQTGLKKCFIMIPTKCNEERTPKTIMHCFKSKNPLLPPNDQNSLYISLLLSTPIQQGLGGKMLKFAQILSKRINCKGRFHLTADGYLLPQRVPHIFYRKFGLTTGKKSIDKKMDRFIKNNKHATAQDFHPIVMYYTPQHNKKETIITKIKDLLKRFTIKKEV